MEIKHWSKNIFLQLVKKLSLVAFLLFSYSVYSQVTVTRGTFLQKGGDTFIQVKFFTNIPVTTAVRYGTSPAALFNIVNGPGPNLNHTLSISGLTPNTTYYYAVYKGDSLMQGGPNHYFKTSQSIGSTSKLRVWVTGDMGTGTANQVAVATQMENYIGTNHLDAWLLLGDNAYSVGSDIEYTTKFFQPYQNKRFMKQTVIWPSPGNHDYGGSPTNQVSHNIRYFDIFSVPQLGELGGHPSGVPQYYSYNINNVHFVSLDSYGIDNGGRLSDTLISTQVSWLKADLAANTQPWTIIYFHHPPYTMGSHNSDTELDLLALRTNLVPIFEKYKVDLVLNGHSHTYERSRPLKGNFGLENTFNVAAHNNGVTSTAKYDGSPDTCPYVRRPNQISAQQGIVYAVVGSSGWAPSGQVSFPHEALLYGNKTNAGSMLLEIEGNRLDAKWITELGVLDDKFTMVKSNPKDSTIILPAGANPLTITASYKPSYLWPSTNQTSQQITLPNVENGQILTVADGMGCLNDKFTIIKTPDCPMAKTQATNYEGSSVVKIEAANTISSNKIINPGTNTKFDAGQSIILSPGFSVQSGAVFKAYIDGCGNLRTGVKK